MHHSRLTLEISCNSNTLDWLYLLILGPFCSTNLWHWWQCDTRALVGVVHELVEVLHELKDEDSPQVDRVVTGAKPRPHVARERGGCIPEMTTITRLHFLGIATKNIWRETKKELALRVKITLINFCVHMHFWAIVWQFTHEFSFVQKCITLGMSSGAKLHNIIIHDCAAALLSIAVKVSAGIPSGVLSLARRQY